jgi:hypothetical protein
VTSRKNNYKAETQFNKDFKQKERHMGLFAQQKKKGTLAALFCVLFCASPAWAQEPTEGQEENGAETSAAEPAKPAPAVQATPAPKPNVKGAPVAAKTPVPVKEPTPEEKEKAWHEKTPQSLSKRLFLGATLGLGVGQGAEKNDKGDHLSGQLIVQYSALAVVPGKSDLIAEIQYGGTTGVNTDEDTSLALQSFLAGVGLDWNLAAKGEIKPEGETPASSLAAFAAQRIRFQGIALVGAYKRKAFSQESGQFANPKYGFAAGVDLRYLHLLSDRIEAVVGVGAQPLGAKSYEGRLGFLASF